MENPLGFRNKGDILEDNFVDYEIRGSKLLVQEYNITFDIHKDRICMNNNCFKKEDKGEDVVVKSIDLKVNYGGELSLGFTIFDTGTLKVYHSNMEGVKEVRIEKALFDYIKDIASRVKFDETSEYYNPNTFDEREYELSILTSSGKFTINTNGLRGDVPFEVKALVVNLIKVLEQNV